MFLGLTAIDPAETVAEVFELNEKLENDNELHYKWVS